MKKRRETRNRKICASRKGSAASLPAPPRSTRKAAAQVRSVNVVDPDFPDDLDAAGQNRRNYGIVSMRWGFLGDGAMDHPAGESDDDALRVDFDRRLTLEFHGSRITSDAGLLTYRELDDAFGLTILASGALSEARRGRNTWHLLAGPLRQSVFGRLVGYADVNDADRLAHDPAMRAVADRGGLDRRAASTSRTFSSAV